MTPQANQWPVVGHRWAVDLLGRTLAPDGRGPRHAYLLLGPPQIGKSTLARAFAQALLCTGAGDGEQDIPCGSCRSCLLMKRGGHPDFRLVQPTDRDGEPDRSNGVLRVEQASDVIREAMLYPLEGAYRIFLIQDAHLANDSFCNKLLKTLEEPPAHTILCVTAHDRSQLLPTIVSRCQVLDLRPVDAVTSKQYLTATVGISPERAELLARFSAGRIGWAIGEAERGEDDDQRSADLDELQRLCRADRVTRLAFSQQLSKKRDDKRIFGMLALWVSWWRDVMLVQSGCPEACHNVDRMDRLISDAKCFDPRQVRRYLSDVGRIEGYLHHTVNAGLALDVLLLNLPRPVRERARVV